MMDGEEMVPFAQAEDVTECTSPSRQRQAEPYQVPQASAQKQPVQLQNTHTPPHQPNAEADTLSPVQTTSLAALPPRDLDVLAQAAAVAASLHRPNAAPRPPYVEVICSSISGRDAVAQKHVRRTR